MENPLVSVLCITYNHENYISQALDSFLMQETDFPYEIIVHDDASTAGPPEIIREYLRRYPAKLKVILQTENQMSKGSSVIDEFLIPAAAGKYAALCEGDDYWTDPHKLQKQADYMKANPQCSLCVHASDYVHPDGSFMREEKRYPESCLVPTGEVILGGGGFCHTGSIMTYLQLYRTLPDYCHMLPIGDYPLQIYLASSGETYYFADKMSAYRFNAAGSWTSRVRMNFKVLAELEEGIIRMLRRFDEVTERRFHEAVEKRIRTESFKLLEYTGDYKGMLCPAYRGEFRGLPTKQRVKIILGRFALPILSLYRVKRENGR
jgi:glycosyltransferase involved in cell wall biosynthesis